MKLAKDGLSEILRKRRPRSKNGVSKDEAGVFIRYNGKTVWRKLGDWEAPDIEAKYRQLKNELEDNGGNPELSDENTLAFLFEFYLKERAWQLSRTDACHLRLIISLVLEIFPDCPISKFTAMSFRHVRKHVAEVGMSRKPMPWSRNYANKLLKYIKTIFNWGVSYDLVPPEIAAKVASVPAISERESDLEERAKVVEVPDHVVRQTLPFLPPVVADMVKVQRGACMRPKEVRELRVGDIDKTGEIWMIRTDQHKTARFGVKRFIAFGVAEVKILRRRCENKTDDDFVFSPRDAMLENWAERAAARKTPMMPSQRLRAETRAQKKLDKIGHFYSPNTYRQSISDAIKKAARAGIPIPHWHPYQLRHASVTATSMTHGRETASLLAGHKSFKTTEVYDHKTEPLTRNLAGERVVGWWE